MRRLRLPKREGGGHATQELRRGWVQSPDSIPGADSCIKISVSHYLRIRAMNFKASLARLHAFEGFIDSPAEQYIRGAASSFISRDKVNFMEEQAQLCALSRIIQRIDYIIIRRLFSGKAPGSSDEFLHHVRLPDRVCPGLPVL
jgi:hypothetical protein